MTRNFSSVKGFLIPTFTQDLPGGRKLNGLTRVGADMVAQGYACGTCLAYFDQPMLLSCPVCSARYDPFDFVEPPQMWLDYLAERYADEPVAKPEVINPLAAVEAVSKNPDVEKIPLEKLKPSKKGRGK